MIEKATLEREIEMLKNDVEELKEHKTDIEFQVEVANEELDYSYELIPAYKTSIT